MTAVAWPLPWGPVVRGVRAGDGPGVALLLHEPGADLDAWADLPVRLARELPLTAIALDLPGHGLSDDPWEPERLGELVSLVLSGGARIQPSPDEHPHPPAPLSHCGGRGGEKAPLPSQWERGWGEGSFLIAAGACATTALALAGELPLAGLVCLSPEAPPTASKPARSPRVPKLIVAGAFAGDDLQTARRLASQYGGWTVVTSLPVPERGTGLLASRRSVQLVEAIVAFLRDCARRPPLARMMPPRG